MSKSFSNRQKKKIAQEGARALRNRPGWNPAEFEPESPLEKLMELDQQTRDEATYQEAVACADCASVREDTGDETALCERHLAEVMGF